MRFFHALLNHLHDFLRHLANFILVPIKVVSLFEVFDRRLDELIIIVVVQATLVRSTSQRLCLLDLFDLLGHGEAFLEVLLGLFLQLAELLKLLFLFLLLNLANAISDAFIEVMVD